MQIQNINTNNKILIIAEIGNNHEGNYDLARDMIGLAADAGADAVKLQTIIPDRLVSINQKERIKQLKRFQLSYREFIDLAQEAESKGVIFLSTPFDIESAQFLNRYVDAFKIASGDNNFFPLIKVIAETGKPIILSTGLMNIDEIKESVSFIKSIWGQKNIKQKLALLHCVSSYPTIPEDANLLSIKELKKITEIVGYSDHTMGIDAALLSVALGARILEKHFTLDNNYSNFHDHQLSANPEDFKKMVNKIRVAEKMLGTGIKTPSDREIEVKQNLRRSIVAKKDLPKGHKINLQDLSWVRPGGGIDPGNEKKVVGKKLNCNVRTGEMIKLNQIN